MQRSFASRKSREGQQISSWTHLVTSEMIPEIDVWKIASTSSKLGFASLELDTKK